MKMKHLLTAALLLTVSTGTQARDIHGVNGFWNYTAAQMQADGFVRVDGNTGNKMKPLWMPNISFDGGYLTDTLGVGGLDDNTKVTEQSWWRSTVYFNYRAQEANLTITKDYPVVMFKFSLPRNGAIEGDVAKAPSITVEHWWKSPYDGTYKTLTNKTGEGINGIAANGRYDYMKVWPGFKCEQEGSKLLGRDSVKIGWEGNHTKYRTNDAGVVYAYRDVKVPATGGEGITQTSYPTWTMAVLPDGSDEANYICILNYGSIEDISETEEHAASGLLLDRTNIESVGFHIMFFGYKTIADCQEAPYAKVKWMKTFASYEDAMNSLTAANNWGDGTESAAKSQLNYQLYYAEQDLNGFSFRNSDPNSPDDPAYMAYQAAYEQAKAVYDNASAADAEVEAAVKTLQEARTALLAEADLPAGLYYNYVKSATGSGAIVVSSDGNLIIGANDAAAAFSFVPSTVQIMGQQAYRLVSANGEVVQGAEGVLTVVEGQTGSNFTFAERDTEGHGFDLKCGDYYYYIDENGQLAAAKEIIVDRDDYDKLSAYLFTIEDALPDYASKATEEQKTGLADGWEFNAAPVDDPGTRGTVDGEVKQMREYAETKMIEGWRMSRWRPFSRVNQVTVKNADDTDATCLALTVASVYDNWDASETDIQNDFSNPAAARMDGGTEDPFYVRDPSPRDATYAYNINAGIKRYMAVKMCGTEDCGFGTLNIFDGLNNKNVLVSIDQLKGQKGDVLYFDLLQCGFPVGKQQWTALFFSPTGFTSADSKILIDWLRFYDSEDAIPEESFADSVLAIETVSFNNKGNNQYYNLSGQRVAKPVKGLYIVNGKKVVIK